MRTIKRYPNRKLYDADARAYVSLEEIATLVRGGETVRVTDHATGEDITAQTLTQVILDEGKRGTSVLPTDLLHGLLRRGGAVVDSGLDTLRHGVDGLVQGSIGRLTRVLPVARNEELEQLRTQLATVERLLADVLQQQSDAPPASTRRKAASTAKKGARKKRS